MSENQTVPEVPPSELRPVPHQEPTKLDRVSEKIEEIHEMMKEHHQKDDGRTRDVDLLVQRVKQFENQMTAMMKKDMIKGYLIPIYDMISDSLKNCQNGQSGEDELNFLKEQITETLRREGAEAYECVKGQEFNRKEHHAIMSNPTENKQEDGTIAEVKKSGFRFEDGEILRHAEVVVNRFKT